MLIKDTLAKLLARENILVDHNPKTQNATFDPKTRKLSLPVLREDLDEDTYDLLIGSGVGRALYSPHDHQTIKQALPRISKNIHHAQVVLDILESIRTERLVRQRYPGLSKIFSNAYMKILGNLGALSGKLDQYSLVDRLNISFKLGAQTTVPFKPEEQNIVDMVSRMKSFNDSVETAKELIKFVEEPPPCEADGDREGDGEGNLGDNDQENQDNKQNKNQNKNQNQNDDNSDGDGDGDSDSKDKNKGKGKNDKNDGDKNDGEDQDQDDGDGDSQEENDSDGDSNDQNDGEDQGNSDDSEGDDESDGNGQDNQDDDNSDGDEEDRQTDEKDANASGNQELDTRISDALNKRLVSYNDPNPTPIVAATFPMELNPDAWICSYKEVYNVCRKHYGNYHKDLAKEYIKKNERIVNYMVREFEMKKRAAIARRVRISKSGVLDTNRIVHAMYSDDVFKRKIDLPEGKNHAMTAYIDWSGSMDPILPGTIDQLINIVMFCRKTRIPHEVYAFSDNPSIKNLSTIKQYSVNNIGKGELYPVKDLRLLQLFSDQMTVKEFNDALYYVFCLREYFAHVAGNKGIPYTFSTHGTPLDSALIASVYINERIRQRTKAEILKTCILTDGASNAGVSYKNDRGVDSICNSNFYLRDRVSGITRKVNSNNQRDSTGMFVEMASIRCNADYYGFFLTGDDFRIAIKSNPKLKIEDDGRANENYQKNRFVVAKNFGFKEYYLINPSTTDIDPNAALKSNRKLNIKAFSQGMKQRQIDRVLLSRFMTEIAT